MLIIGSTALKTYSPNIEPKDLDIICFRKQVKDVAWLYQAAPFKDTKEVVTLKKPDGTFIECLLADDKQALQQYLKFDRASANCLKTASLPVLFSIKKGHVHFPLKKFDKHVRDYNKLLSLVNGVDILSDVTKLHYKETEDRLGKLRTPSLDKTVEQFFGQSKEHVKSWFIHDDIHFAMKHYEVPLYEKMQRDKTMAKCDKDLWDGFSFYEKMECVLEEAYVIALERKQIPFIFGEGSYEPALESLVWAMKRICTTLCSGWFRSFATDNYVAILNHANRNYVEYFLEKVESGEIKPIKQ